MSKAILAIRQTTSAKYVVNVNSRRADPLVHNCRLIGSEGHSPARITAARIFVGLQRNGECDCRSRA